MSTQPFAGVLLIPNKQHASLTQGGACKSRPPTVYSYGPWLHEVSAASLREDTRPNCAYCGHAWPCDDAGQPDGGQRWVHGGMVAWPDKLGEALVLAWDRKPLDLGCFLVAKWDGLDLFAKLVCFLTSEQTPDEVAELRAYLEPYGHVVLIDENHRPGELYMEGVQVTGLAPDARRLERAGRALDACVDFIADGVEDLTDEEVKQELADAGLGSDVGKRMRERLESAGAGLADG